METPQAFKHTRLRCLGTSDRCKLTPDKQLSFGFLFCPPLCGHFFGQLFDGDLCPWVLRVKPPVRMPLLDLPVVHIDQPLQQVQDQALIQVRPAAGVIDRDVHANVPRHQRGNGCDLLPEILRIVESFLTLYQSGHSSKLHNPPRICF